MNGRLPAIAALLAALTGCETTGGSGSVGFHASYYGGYYPGYPGYWYDDDVAVVVRPPGDRPERPTTLPAQLPAAKPSAEPRPSPTMAKPASRPMPRARPRGR